MEATQRTVGQWLEELAASNQSTDEDSVKMQNLLHIMGFKRAVVVLGIVYLEGRGTIDAPPASINGVAKELVREYQAGLLKEQHEQDTE